MKWSIFEKLPQVLWCFRSKCTDIFFAKKGTAGWHVATRCVEISCLKLQTLGKRKENDSSEQENLPVYWQESGEVHSLKVCQLVIALKMARAKVLGVFVFGLQRSFLAHFWLQKESGKNRQTLKALGPASCLNGIGWSGFASFKRKSWSSEIMIFRFHVKLQCVPKTKFLSCIL